MLHVRRYQRIQSLKFKIHVIKYKTLAFQSTEVIEKETELNVAIKYKPLALQSTGIIEKETKSKVCFLIEIKLNLIFVYKSRGALASSLPFH